MAAVAPGERSQVQHRASWRIRSAAVVLATPSLAGRPAGANLLPIWRLDCCQSGELDLAQLEVHLSSSQLIHSIPFLSGRAKFTPVRFHFGRIGRVDRGNRCNSRKVIAVVRQTSIKLAQSTELVVFGHNAAVGAVSVGTVVVGRAICARYSSTLRSDHSDNSDHSEQTHFT